MKKQELRDKVEELLHNSDGPWYYIDIEGEYIDAYGDKEIFEDRIGWDLTEEGMYQALGFDFDKLSEMKKLLSELDEAYKQFLRSKHLLESYDYGKKRWAKSDYEQAKIEYEQIESEYDKFMESLGDEAERYEKYADIDWVAWEETPAFQNAVDDFVEELEKIIKNNELKNYRIY
ncbi:hydrogenase iron-sulfur subunit [Aerococcaceae bacterium NML160702]|nr:hydrogenase iron-sulfur subunit [Aerococcaceae bacterium NML160702]